MPINLDLLSKICLLLSEGKMNEFEAVIEFDGIKLSFFSGMYIIIIDKIYVHNSDEIECITALLLNIARVVTNYRHQ